MPEEDRCTLSPVWSCAFTPKKNLHFWACCEKSHGINQLGAQALQPNHIRSHHDQEKHIIDSLIENMWKAHYQKDLLQSLKQNASIKYIIYGSQVWNRHVFIKCTNKIILLVAGEDVHVKVVPVTPCRVLVERYTVFSSSDHLHLDNHLCLFTMMGLSTKWHTSAVSYNTFIYRQFTEKFLRVLGNLLLVIQPFVYMEAKPRILSREDPSNTWICFVFVKDWIGLSF